MQSLALTIYQEKTEETEGVRIYRSNWQRWVLRELRGLATILSGLIFCDTFSGRISRPAVAVMVLPSGDRGWRFEGAKLGEVLFSPFHAMAVVYFLILAKCDWIVNRYLLVYFNLCGNCSNAIVFSDDRSFNFVWEHLSEFF